MFGLTVVVQFIIGQRIKRRCQCIAINFPSVLCSYRSPKLTEMLQVTRFLNKIYPRFRHQVHLPLIALICMLCDVLLEVMAIPLDCICFTRVFEFSNYFEMISRSLIFQVYWSTIEIK